MTPITASQTQQRIPWSPGEKTIAVVIALGILGFLTLWMLMESNLVQPLDEAMIRGLRVDAQLSDPIGPDWFLETARDYTALGGYGVLVTITTLVAIFLYLERRHLKARFVLAVIISGYLVSMMVKDLIGRPRPEIVPYLAHVYTSIGEASFPSGHATMSTIVYVTLGLMLSELSSRRLVKGFVLLAPMTIAFLVGASRVLMGVHYPTDVLAGCAAGLSWALSAWLIRSRWRKYHPIQAASDLAPSTRW